MNEEKKRTFIDEFLSFSLHIGLGFLIAIFLVTFVFRFTIVKGESMAQTLNNNQVLYMDKVGYRFNNPERGDIVICRYPYFSENCIKRVIAMPGETIGIKNGVVYVNDDPTIDEWQGNYDLADMATIRVPDNCYFVMGDNRGNSKDSRDKSVGCIPKDKIYGKAVFSLYPFDKVGTIKFGN
ncbi:MAG: signal peptidase I [Clostridia bacterium]|nr:signal peptidase I [Clostridia bacterium]